MSDYSFCTIKKCHKAEYLPVIVFVQCAMTNEATTFTAVNKGIPMWCEMVQSSPHHVSAGAGSYNATDDRESP